MLKYVLGWLAIITLFRLIAPNYMVHYAILATALLYMFLPKRLPFFAATVIFAFILLFMRYVSNIADGAEFSKTVMFYAYAFLLIIFMVRILKWPKNTVFYLGLTLFAIALNIENKQTMKALKPLWDTILQPVLREDDPVSAAAFPYGISSPIVSNQAPRYPELAQRDFSFLGSRASFCEQISYYHRTPMCSENFEDFPYAIWTNFYLTQPFMKLFLSGQEYTSALQLVRDSYAQGVNEFTSTEGPYYRERPYCSAQGYLQILNVYGDGIDFSVGRTESGKVTLPVFADSRFQIETSRTARQSVSDTGLIQFDVKRGPTQIQIRPPRIWTWTIASFWLPFGLWLIMLGFKFSSWLILVLKGREVDEVVEPSPHSESPALPPPNKTKISKRESPSLPTVEAPH